jgi:hypothetical protein
LPHLIQGHGHDHLRDVSGRDLALGPPVRLEITHAARVAAMAADSRAAPRPRDQRP